MNQTTKQKSSAVLSPSLISLDLCNVAQQVKTLEENGIQALHVDILDGYFSPSMPIGLDVIRQLRKLTDLPFDAHVMANAPQFFIDELLDIGVQQLIFHLETEPHVDHMLTHIKKAGAKAGVALKPSTPLSALEYVLERCDAVLLMMINPGYAGHAGESKVPYAYRKLTALREMIERQGLNTRIEIDGRISPEDILNYGVQQQIADIFVIGSTCIKRGDVAGSLAALRQLCGDPLEGKLE